MTEATAGRSATGTATTVRSRLGLPILIRTWPAVGSRPRGRILLVHGLAEHSGRYETTGRRLAEAGFELRAFDLPGFGASGGRRAYVDRWADYLDVVAEQLGGLGPPGPSILFGHSMGALIALTYVLAPAAAHRPLPDLLVLSAPPIGRPPVPLATRLAASVLSRLVPRLEIGNGLRREQLSHDPAVGQAYVADPLVHARTTTRLGAAIFDEMARASRLLGSLDRLPVPTLVLHGSEDTIASPAGSAVFARVGRCDYRVLPGLRHEILNEPQGAELVAEIAAWIDSAAPDVAGGDPAGAAMESERGGAPWAAERGRGA